MTWLEIIDKYYPQGSKARGILMMHSFQVASLALEIARSLNLPLDTDEIISAAMLHDIGIIGTNAPSLGCEGSMPYLSHGDIGAEMIRTCAPDEMEVYARVAERHTGTGITPEEISAQGLPLSLRSHMPETMLEKLICYADKFYSKSASMRRKTVDEARRSVAKFGTDSALRFDALRKMFEEN